MQFNVAGLLKSSTGDLRVVDVEGVVDIDDPMARVIAPIRGRARLIREPAGVLVEADLTTRLELTCARCLAPVEEAISVEVTESFQPTVYIPGGPPVATDDSDPATFTVTAENDAPVVTDIPDQTIAEGASFTTITLDNFVSDLDNTDAEMTWTYSGNTSLTVGIVDRVATITIPNADWNGAETITFRATDPGMLFDEDAATFTVTADNDAPEVDNPISDQQHLARTQYGYPVPANTFSDVEGDTLTLTAALADGNPLPAWLSFDGSAFSGTPTNDNVGIWIIRVTADDGQGGMVYDDFNLEVILNPYLIWLPIITR